jgi:hypothetical protein
MPSTHFGCAVRHDFRSGVVLDIVIVLQSTQEQFRGRVKSNQSRAKEHLPLKRTNGGLSQRYISAC